MDSEARANSRPLLPLPFALVVAALLGLSQLAFAASFGVTANGQASLALQHGMLVAAFLAVHAAAPPALVRRLAVVALFAYVLITLLDLLSLSVFSVRVDGVVRVLSLGDPLGALQLANVSATVLASCAGALLATLAVFIQLYRKLPRVQATTRGVAAALASPLVLAGAFVGEQVWSQSSDGYLRRSAVLPGYYRLFSPASDQFVLSLPPLATDAELDAALTSVTAARNPKNILFIVLESVRDDVVDETLTPSLVELGKRSLVYTRAYTEAPSTPRAWNVLLLNRPAFTAYQESLGLDEEQPQGAFPLRVLERAGYSIFVSMPCFLEWLGFDQRIVGAPGLVDRFFSSYPGHDQSQHISDQRATDQIVAWLEEPALPQPFFALIQLDSTHYTYHFHEERVVVRPYSTAANPYLVATQADMDLVFNRYKNAVHEVDYNIGHMLAAIERSGRGADTAVVIASDHGQSFKLGAAAHMPVNDATKRIPMILHLPGIEPAVVDDYVSHANVFPTLFDYLGVEGLDDHILIGRSLLSREQRSSSALTFRGDMKEAHLSFPLFSIVFDLARLRNVSLTFTPSAILDKDEQPIEGWRGLLARVPWKDELQAHLQAQPWQDQAPTAQ